jgi:hypothetical protein
VSAGRCRDCGGFVELKNSLVFLLNDHPHLSRYLVVDSHKKNLFKVGCRDALAGQKASPARSTAGLGGAPEVLLQQALPPGKPSQAPEVRERSPSLAFRPSLREGA